MIHIKAVSAPGRVLAERLEGSVRAWVERDTIERAAWAAPGVRAVDDRIGISL